jgi:DNA adenine methylase
MGVVRDAVDGTRWHQGTRWKRVVETIPAWHERLRGVSILHRDAFDVLPRIGDEEGTVIYCDPPYVQSSRGSSERYMFDFEQNLLHDDHARLASALARFRKGRVVVSYYDCPRVRHLYAGWQFVNAKRRKNLANTGRAKPSLGKGNDELVIVNRALEGHGATP